MVTLLSVVNNGDGTYTLTFDAPITNIAPGVDTTDPNILLNPNDGTAWVPAITNAAEVGATITITATGSPLACSEIVILDQPAVITAGTAFQVAAPTTPVT